MMDVPEANHCIPLWYLRVNSFFFRWNNGSRSAPSVDQKPWKQGNHPNNMDRIGSKGWHNLPGTFGLLKDDHLLCPPGGVSKGTCSTRTCGKFQVDVMFVCDQKISKYIIYIYICMYTIIYCFRLMMFLLNLVIFAAFQISSVPCGSALSLGQVHISRHQPSRQQVNRWHCPNQQCSKPEMSLQ